MRSGTVGSTTYGVAKEANLIAVKVLDDDGLQQEMIISMPVPDLQLVSRVPSLSLLQTFLITRPGSQILEGPSLYLRPARTS
ncbi:hypothetical protein C0992_000140 [Termitomyces sp. T32_za158]|nr:hypothetical protein C0992_000140 [Termitomyces sp. T32_za158]